MLGSVFFVCGLSFYLGEVDSHLLLSLAGSVHPLRHGANIGQTQLRLVYSGVSHELRSCLPPLVLLGNVLLCHLGFLFQHK